MEHETAHFEVEVALLPMSHSSRKLAFASGYRPNHKHPITGEYFMGQFTVAAEVAPGMQARANVAVIAMPEQIAALAAFGSWTIWEGPNHVGSVRII